VTLLEAQTPDLDATVDEPAVPPVTPVGCGVLWPPLDFSTASEAASAPVAASAGETVAMATPRRWDIVDEWGMDSFPASDPPANW
jgi:hypothetical protein